MAPKDESSQINRAKVKIAGEQYVIKSERPEGHIAAVARLVDSEMNEILRKKPNLPRHQAAILAALNIADEAERLRREKSELLNMMDEVS